MKFVRHPTTKAWAVPVEKDMLMLVGEKTSATREKIEHHETKEDAKESLKRGRDSIRLESNLKAGLDTMTIVYSD